VTDGATLDGKEPDPPGLMLPVHRLKSEVVSCEQAAAAKRIPLANELKTIIVDTSLGIRAVHVPGNKRVSLRAVKRALACNQAFIAPPECLQRLGLKPGTVCPVLNPVWAMTHLISKAVLDLTFVSTNNGRLSEYLLFPPGLLLGARRVLVGTFDC
jgi:prolyl-tRNA editing enzyme YbaK/EbsC (Cys-tRNA(Pro) deacylase)